MQYALLNHEQRLQMIEASQPQMARSINALVEHAEVGDNQASARLAQLEKTCKELQTGFAIAIGGVIMIAALSAISVGYLANQQRGVANVVNQI